MKGENLALNSQQGLICHKTQPTNQNFELKIFRLTRMPDQVVPCNLQEVFYFVPILNRKPNISILNRKPNIFSEVFLLFFKD